MTAAAPGYAQPGIVYSDVIPDAPTAHRAAGSTDSETDMSSAGFGVAAGIETIGNRQSLAIWVEFATSGASCTLNVVFYDGAGTPMCVSETLTFTASTQRKSASGTYLSARQIIDAAGFRGFKIQKLTISSGNITVYACPI